MNTLHDHAGKDPMAYMNDILAHLPRMTNRDDLRALPPRLWQSVAHFGLTPTAHAGTTSDPEARNSTTIGLTLRRPTLSGAIWHLKRLPAVNKRFWVAAPSAMRF